MTALAGALATYVSGGNEKPSSPYAVLREGDDVAVERQLCGAVAGGGGRANRRGAGLAVVQVAVEPDGASTCAYARRPGQDRLAALMLLVVRPDGPIRAESVSSNARVRGNEQLP